MAYVNVDLFYKYCFFSRKSNTFAKTNSMLKKITLLLLSIFVSMLYCQNLKYYLDPPNDSLLKEVHFVSENDQFWQIQKYYYNSNFKLEKSETLNPFNILTESKKYEYNKEGQLTSIQYLNRFNFAFERQNYEYYPNKYIITTRNESGKKINVKEFDLKNRVISELTFKKTQPSYKYTYQYIYPNSKDYDYNIYSPDGLLDERITYKFNILGGESEIYKYGNDRLLKHKIVYNYNENNKLKSIITYNTQNSIIEKTEFIYNNSYLVSRVSTGENGAFKDKLENVYNKNGKLIKSISYKPEILTNKILFDSEYQYLYNGNNNLVYIKNYNNNSGKKVIYKEYFLDNEQRLLKSREYYLGKISSEIFFDQGLEKKQIRYDEKGKIQDIILSEYDKNGNLVLVTTTLSDGTLKEKFAIEYDKSGNKKMIEYN